jgi:hypothetical protein
MMKKRLFLVAVLSIFFLFSVSVNSVNATEGWYEQCVVQGVGSQSGLGLVLVSGGTNNLPFKWYALGTNTTEANQGMAVALTAIQTGGTVSLRVDPNDESHFWPIIKAIAVNPVQ